MLAVCSTSAASAQMIVPLGSDIRLLALSPSPSHVKLQGDKLIKKSEEHSSCGQPSHTSGLSGGWVMG